MSSATRESNEFSITIRPGDADGVDKYRSKYLAWLEDISTHYAVALEQKGDLSTQHFQCAIVTKLAHRSDNLKKTLVVLLGTLWSEDQKRIAVCVNKNRQGNDIRLLAGGYCMKQDVNPLLKGWDTEVLEPFISQYEELKTRSEMRNPTRDKIIDILKNHYNDISEHKNPDVRWKFTRKSPREQLALMFKCAVANGCDLQKYSTPVWLNYLVSNFDVLFRAVSAEDLMELLSNEEI